MPGVSPVQEAETSQTTVGAMPRAGIGMKSLAPFWRPPCHLVRSCAKKSLSKLDTCWFRLWSIQTPHVARVLFVYCPKSQTPFWKRGRGDGEELGLSLSKLPLALVIKRRPLDLLRALTSLPFNTCYHTACAYWALRDCQACSFMPHVHLYMPSHPSAHMHMSMCCGHM